MTAPGRSLSVAEVVHSVAGHGLDRVEARWPEAPLDATAWQALLTRVTHERLGGLLQLAVLDGVLPVTAEQDQQVRRRHLDAVCSSLRLEAATLRTLAVLDSAGVPAKVLKGPAVAHLDYPDPALRLFSDVDLLVPAEAFDRGVAALQAAGHVRRYPQPRPGFDRRFSKGTSFHTPDGLEVDYHRVFAMGPFGLRLPAADLWRTEQRFPLGGRSLAALGDDERFLHACYHTVLGSPVPRLAPQRDVAQMLQGDGVDLQRVDHLAARWGSRPVLARALSTTFATLRLEPTALSRWADAYPYSRRERSDLAVYTDLEGGYAGKSLAGLRALPLRDRFAYTAALALPSRAYVTSRYASTGARWQAGLRAARRLWSGA